MKKTGLILAILVACILLAGYGFYMATSDKSARQTTSQEVSPTAREAARPGSGSAPPAADAGQNAALVNGTPIPKADYDEEIARLDRQIAMTGRTPNDQEVSAMKQQVLDSMIGREVLRQEAAKQGIKADDAETSVQMESLKKRFGSEEEFKNAMAKLSISEQALRDQFASEIAMRKLIDREVADKITVGREEAKAFYDGNPEIFKTPEMVRASHILVKVEKDASPEDKAKALEKIKEIQKKIQGGADFAEVAKETSDCPSKENGGDLSYFQRGQMVGAFEEAAFALKPGQVSDIVETEFGYHLIRLVDKKESGMMSFEEMEPRIEQHVKSEKVSEQLSQYVDRLKANSKVEVFVK